MKPTIPEAALPTIPDWRQLVGYEHERSIWARLVTSSRMPPVILLTGREGLGKSMLLAHLAALFVCQQAKACGQCENCQWLLHDIHPEVLWIEASPDQPKLNLEVAARLQEHLSLSPGPDVRARLVVIPDADQLNLQAANRLLKTLEEPPPGTAILMSTSRLHAMLPTVLSRCVKWRLSPPPAHETALWLQNHMSLPKEGQVALSPDVLNATLKMAGLAPGKALALLRERFEANDHEHSIQAWEDKLAHTLEQAAVAPGKGLAIAHTLSKETGIDLGELTALYERSINKTYWNRLESPGDHAPSVVTIATRRNKLQKLKQLVRKERIHLNAQLALESLALGENS